MEWNEEFKGGDGELDEERFKEVIYMLVGDMKTGDIDENQFVDTMWRIVNDLVVEE